MFGLTALIDRTLRPEPALSTSRRASDASRDASKPAADGSASVPSTSSTSSSDTDTFARVGRVSSRSSSAASSRSPSPTLTRLDKGKGREVLESAQDKAPAQVQAGEPAHDAAATQAATPSAGASAATGAPTEVLPTARTQGPESTTPATKSRVEILVDGVYQRLVATWAAIVALARYLVGGLTGAYATAQQGLHTAATKFNQAKRSAKAAVAGQLRHLQGYAAADVVVADSTYARLKARTKARVRSSCAYLLNKLQDASVGAAAAGFAPANTAAAEAEKKA